VAALLVADCPWCRSREMTFDAQMSIQTRIEGWRRWYEVFCVCPHCSRSTVFVLAQRHSSDEDFLKEHSPVEINGPLNASFEIDGNISIKDIGASATHLANVSDQIIANAYREGSVSLANGSWKAAGTMFGLVIDLATTPMLPKEEVAGLNNKTRRDLGLRLSWLFENGKLPNDLRELAKCVREDGNDGAHAGTLTKEDAEDLQDFATALLQRIFY
jgi:Domain of unknown function (DUF4145)